MLFADHAALQPGVHGDQLRCLAQDLVVHRDDVPIDILY